MSKISNITNRYKDVKIENNTIKVRLYRWTEEEFFEYAKLSDDVNSGKITQSEMFRELAYRILKKDDNTTTREDVKNVLVFDKKMLIEEQLKLSGLDLNSFDDKKKTRFTQKKKLTTLERTKNLRKALLNQ